jgi:RHS repeat-associated protein
MSGRGLHFTYDTAGNRKTAAVDTEQVSYTDGQGNPGGNNLNQVKARGILKTRVSGTADPGAGISIDGEAITRDGSTRYWDAVLASVQQYRQIAVKATLSGQSQSQNVWALFRPASETLTYDDDGNLTGDGVWTYTWDAENRLIQMDNGPARGWNMPSRTITFVYDYLGRRVRKTTTDNGVTTDRKYVYQGWNLIAELDASCNVLRSFAWGLDIQSSLTASGGVGSLVLETVHTSSSLAAYHIASDANGNVVALVSQGGTGNLAAVYEYDAFGQLLRKTGPDAANNPFRFSTKFHDQETGLIYYGYRYYDANLGRFINRDIISEAGGSNLYAFVGNNPINRWDYLGQWWGEETWRKAWGKVTGWISHIGSEDTEEIVVMDEFYVEADRSEAAEQAQQDQEGIGSNSGGWIDRFFDWLGRDAVAEAEENNQRIAGEVKEYGVYAAINLEANPIGMSVNEMVAGSTAGGQSLSGGDYAVRAGVTILGATTIQQTVNGLKSPPPAGAATNAPKSFENKYPGDRIAPPRQTFTPEQLKNKAGAFNYVVTADGKLIIGRIDQSPGGGHIDLAGGNPVIAAGEVKIVNGQIRYVDNSSGHYEPVGASAQNAAIDAFNKAGLNATGKYVEKIWNGRAWVPRE